MKYEQMNNNKVMLTGKVVSKAKFSHETFGEGFYELTLAVPRLSDKEDLIPVLVSEYHKLPKTVIFRFISWSYMHFSAEKCLLSYNCFSFG